MPGSRTAGSKGHYRPTISKDFINACGYFLQQVARIHGPAQLEYPQNRMKKRGIYAVDIHANHRGRSRGRFGSHGRSNRGRSGGRGGRGTHMINGVDVSDPFRNFSASEWEALGPNGGRTTVLQMREYASGRGGRDGRGRGRGRARGDSERNVGAVGAAIVDNTQQADDHHANAVPDRGGRNGRGFGRGAYGSTGGHG